MNRFLSFAISAILFSCAMQAMAQVKTVTLDELNTSTMGKKNDVPAEQVQNAMVPQEPAVEIKVQNTLPANEIGLTYGRVTTYDCIFVTAGVFASMFSLGYATFQNYHSQGAVALEYYRNLNKTFSVGGVIGRSGGSFDLYNKNGDQKVFDGHYSYHTVDFMAAAKAYWFRKSSWGMYSKLGLGIASIGGLQETSSISVSDFMMSFQVSPVCFEFGGGALKGALETGFGSQGLIAAGVRYSF